MSSKNKNKENKGIIKTSTEETQVSAKKDSSPKKNKENMNTAIILDGINEIRRYTKTIHGEKFVEAAEEFATAHSYKIKLVEVKPGVPCPNCGHNIEL